MMIFNIPIFSVLSFSLGLLCLSLGVFVLTRNPKSDIHRIYFFFCLSTSFWMIPISFLSSKIFSYETSLFLAKCVFTGVVFMPSLLLHFAIELLGPNVKLTAKKQLAFVYFLSVFFLFLLWLTPNFITGIYNYPWGYYPKGGFIHPIHVLVVVMPTAIYGVFLLGRGVHIIEREHGKTKKYYETKYAFLAFLFITLSGIDFLQNWGVDFFPLGNIFVAAFIILITYAIFKHALLGISIVIRKSLIYSILISIITAIYFSIVYITSLFIGGLTNSASLPVVLFILAIITLLFKPLEQRIQNVLDKLFFKNPREVLEKENILLREEVQKQDQMKAVATLAAGMAHEIKNPLTSIKTFAEYLPQRYDDPEFREKFQRIVVDEVDRVNNIVKQLLEFSKPRELELKATPIVSILDDTLSLLNNNLLKNKIEVIKDYKADPSPLVDKNQLRQAFLNIFLNSIHAMPNGGTLTVATSLSSDLRLLTSVKDTGSGISKEHLPHVFDPFYSTKEEGTGLGLSIVHGIITKHGGKIKVESEEGKGTTIRVIL